MFALIALHSLEFEFNWGKFDLLLLAAGAYIISAYVQCRLHVEQWNVALEESNQATTVVHTEDAPLVCGRYVIAVMRVVVPCILLMLSSLAFELAHFIYSSIIIPGYNALAGLMQNIGGFLGAHIYGIAALGFFCCVYHDNAWKGDGRLHMTGLHAFYRAITRATEDAYHEPPPECMHKEFAASTMAYLIIDSLRLVVAQLLHQITRSACGIVSRVAPPGVRFYCYEEPVPDIAGVRLGIALQARPLASNDKPPGMISINIGTTWGGMRQSGELPPQNKMVEGMEEVMIRTSSAQMLESLASDPNAAENGFVGALQAEFNDCGRLCMYNISSWESEDSARQWAQNSSLHKDLTRDYQGKGLATFSSTLMNLGPVSAGIRRNRRCMWCRGVSRDRGSIEETEGKTHCTKCNAPYPKVPWF